jgi:hypothetical protein
VNDTRASDDHEPTIVSATVAAGHDGVAEAAITVRYPNGAERSMSLPYEVVDRALDIARASSLDDLIGQPWTMLVVEARDPLQQ